MDPRIAGPPASPVRVMRRGCHPGDWNCALALPKRASGYDDAVVATWAFSCAAAIRIGDDSGACLGALAKRVSASAAHSPLSCA